MEWNDAWGKPSDFNIVEGRTELGRFKIGDRVEIAHDDEENGYFRGDSGVVAGFSHTKGGMFNPEDRDEVFVAFDDLDPGTTSPDNLELE